jgi:hypothetical protein
MRVTDASSGVKRVRVLVVSPSEAFVSRVPLKLVSGTTHDGVWAGMVPLSRCASEAGRWSTLVDVRDNAGRGRFYGPIPGVTVAAGDHAQPRFDLPSRAVAPAGPMVLEFDEDVTGASTDSLVVRRLTDSGPSPAQSGSWVCTDKAAASTSCASGSVRMASFTPAAAFVRGARYEIAVNPEHVLGLTDLAGNPAGPRATDEFFVRQP